MSHSIARHRQRPAPAINVPDCRNVDITTDLIRRVLVVTYDRFLCGTGKQSWPGRELDLLKALELCWMGARHSRRASEVETLRRLCEACYFRLTSGKDLDLAGDLEYLDALQDAAYEEWPYNWKITANLGLVFP